MKMLLEMFLTFAKVGVMTFGGGYAMIPIIQREVVDRHGWVSGDELMDYYAIGQCTPGLIAANTSALIGYKLRGIAGGIAATLGVVFPSFVIIVIIAGILSNFSDIPAVQSAFAGVRVCVCVLIFNSVLKLWKGAVKDKAALGLFLAVFLLSVFLDVSPVLYVLVCAVAGVVFTQMGVRGK